MVDKTSNTNGQVISPYVPRMARIISVQQFTPREKLFRLAMEDGAGLSVLPMQFVQVSVFGVGEAPISVCSSSSNKDYFELCVRAVGALTNALHKMGPEDRLGVRGPYGNGFDPLLYQGMDFLVVAGGLGLAPVRPVILRLLENRAKFGKVTILYGARNPAELLFKDDLKEWSERQDIEFLVTVDRPDEGWEGNVGVITTLYRKVRISPVNTLAVIVGPPVMFKFAVLETLSCGVPEHRIICSLERKMRCGVGKCGHCQIRNVYVCRSGPVFTYEQVKRLREGI